MDPFLKKLALPYLPGDRDLILSIVTSLEHGVIVTPNIDHIVRIMKDKDIHNYYQNADLCLNDSKLYSLLSYLFFGKRIHVVTGADLTHSLLISEFIAKKRLCIVGSTKDQIKTLSKSHEFIDLTYISHIMPSYGFYNSDKEIEEVLEFCVKSKASLFFLCVGSPQQEMLATLLRNKLKVGIILCVGASIDYLSGREKRAPKYIQTLYLEWLYRFAQSPIKRFKRYFINCPQIFYYLFREKYFTK